MSTFLISWPSRFESLLSPPKQPPCLVAAPRSSARGAASRNSRPRHTFQFADRAASRPRTHLHAAGNPAPESDPSQVASTPSRRQALLSASILASSLAQAVPESEAAYIDEAVATEVFTSAQGSVVSLADFAVVGGEEKVEGVGSGVVWDQLGHIITNYHCIAKVASDKTGSQLTKISVLKRDGTSKTFDATIVGFDKSQDLAVLQITLDSETSLQPVKVGTSSDLKVGQSVYAIGNPFGLSHTLTVGSVSGLRRTIPSASGDRIFGAVQTDASISSGNSGGPLLDSFGRMIGMNTATFTRKGTGRSSGINFAVPIDTIMSLVPKIIVQNAT